jgi:hypothetical protein
MCQDNVDICRYWIFARVEPVFFLSIRKSVAIELWRVWACTDRECPAILKGEFVRAFRQIMDPVLLQALHRRDALSAFFQIFIVFLIAANPVFIEPKIVVASNDELQVNLDSFNVFHCAFLDSRGHRLL